jgi:hypothetical protein
MRKLIIALFILVCAGSLFARTATINIRNTELIDKLIVESSSNGSSEIMNPIMEIKPGYTGVLKIKLNDENEDFNIQLKTSNKNTEICLKSEKNYFGITGLKYMDDYGDDISGDIKENTLYNNIDMNV